MNAIAASCYLDHNATTPLAPSVFEAMRPFLERHHGNPSSRHEYGREARRALDAAREQVAAAVGAHPTEVVFTGSGTEANNLFIKGAAATLPTGRIAVSAVEHPSVMEPALQLQGAGWRVECLPVDAAGRLDDAVATRWHGAVPGLVSLMAANNETGVLQPVAPIAESLRGSSAWVHTDAVQAFGKLPLDFRALGVAAMTVSAHKIGGPKGAAALVLGKQVELQPLLAGGGQERGLRSGTENVAALVGFGRACELLSARLAQTAMLAGLRDTFEAGARALGAIVFGATAPRLANTSFFAFPDIDGETLVGKVDRLGFAVASGSACSSAQPEASHVLRAMGVPDEVARGAIRVSFGPDNSPDDVAGLLAALRTTVDGLRRLASVAA